MIKSDILKKCPALVSLKTLDNPSNDVLRTCILELLRVVEDYDLEIDKLKDKTNIMKEDIMELDNAIDILENA